MINVKIKKLDPNVEIPKYETAGSSGLDIKAFISNQLIINSDYRGEIKIILFNHGIEDFVVNNGDRIAQIVLMPVLKIKFEEVEELKSTSRGFGGFGSTGK